MSDMANAFWNAFKSVMPYEETSRLFCIWHVDRTWQKKLTLVTNQTERVSVYKQLCMLRSETDQEKFEKMLNNFVKNLLKKKSTDSFGKYFKINYTKRTTEWAVCHRHHTYINTNMYLEAMHKTLRVQCL